MQTLSKKNSTYPPILKEIKSPPEQLFILGKLPPNDAPTIAVVGARRCTNYGARVAYEITFALAKAGIVIVSGLAYGIDQIAHTATLDAGGKTIAVLGCGLDQLTSTEQKRLAKRILESAGAIVSEFALGTPPFKGNFPRRNRIISGLSLGTLVIEATSSSGSLITAKCALDQGRELFAVPGSIHSETCGGTNGLLKSGAHVVTTAHDVLDVLGLSGVALIREPTVLPKAETKEEAILLPILTKQPAHLDEIVRKSGLPTSAVSSCLMMMEIKAKIRHVGGNYYILG